MSKGKREPKEAKKLGRPDGFNADRAAQCSEICIKLAIPNAEGICPSLRKVLETDKSYPLIGQIMRWLLNPDEKFNEFREQYALAREVQTELMADEIRDISDESPMATTDYVTKGGSSRSTTALDNAGIQRSRLRVDTRKWIMAKQMPKKYGDAANPLGNEMANLAEELRAARQRAGMKVLDGGKEAKAS